MSASFCILFMIVRPHIPQPRILPCLADRSTKHCRAMTYRLIRHTLIDIESVDKLKELPIDWYMVK